MEPPKTLRNWGIVDVSQLRTCIENQREEAWAEDTYRQQTFRVHAQTQTIRLVFDPDFRHFNPTRHPKYTEFSDALQPVRKLISSFFDHEGWMVRCIVTRLIPKGTIPAHADQGFSLAKLTASMSRSSRILAFASP